MSVILIAGTHEWDGSDIEDQRWVHPQSPFSQYLGLLGLSASVDSSGYGFIWSTDLGGISYTKRPLTNWLAAGRHLYHWVVPPRCPERRIPPDETFVICLSHGLQVVLAACAFGLCVNRLVSVAGPVRKDMAAIAVMARRNIQHWTHLYSDHTDFMQWFGTLTDGRIGVVRAHPLADRNERVPKVGHSGLLRDPQYFPLWAQHSWLEGMK